MSKSLKSVLNDVYVETISMDDQITTKAKQIVQTFVVEEFIRSAMIEADPLFGALYEDVFFTGSFYDGLRIGEASEFDLNIVIDLPFWNADLTLVKADSPEASHFSVTPGFGVYYSDKSFNELMPCSHPRYLEYKNIKQFFKQELVSRKYKYVLMPDKFRSWFESVLNKTRNNVINKNTSWLGRRLYGEQIKSGVAGVNMTFTIHKAGPAFTLHIETTSNLKIDVDLVPVFKCFSAFLVPKPSEGNKLLWRLSYPRDETKIIFGQSCAKKVIKLLKRFRDMQGAPWKKLSSYYLKTVIMLEITHSWHDRCIDKVFIGCLRELLSCLEARNIPFYFDHSFNLLSSVNAKTIDNMRGRLERIMKDIDNNPPITVRKYFVTEECNTNTIDGRSSCSVM